MSYVRSDSGFDYTHETPMSLRSRLIIALLRLTNRRAIYAREFRSERFDRNDVPDAPAALYEEFEVERSQVGEGIAHIIRPRGRPARGLMFFVHGGGFVHNMSKHHWALAAELVRQTGFAAMAPDYPLAPQANIDVMMPFLAAAYGSAKSLCQGLPLVCIGDSAGGTLTLLLTQTDLVRRSPASHIFLLSPWLDLGLANPQIVRLSKRDVMLQIDGLDQAAEAVAGPHPLQSPRVSPIFGDLSGLPPVTLFIGSDEIFLPDCIALRDQIRARGGYIDWCEYPGMFHVWPAVTTLPEARAAIAQIKSQLGRIVAAEDDSLTSQTAG